MDDFDERVKERAYRLWVEEGCPEGRADVHWDRARELVAIEQNQKQTTKPVAREPKGEPVEPVEPVRNLGEFPTMTDQGEGEAAPKPRGVAPRATTPKTAAPKAAAPRAAAARQTSGRKTSEPKGKSPTSKGR
jgi:Protein of unknown function (DUF2934)